MEGLKSQRNEVTYNKAKDIYIKRNFWFYEAFSDNNDQFPYTWHTS